MLALPVARGGSFRPPAPTTRAGRSASTCPCGECSVWPPSHTCSSSRLAPAARGGSRHTPGASLRTTSGRSSCSWIAGTYALLAVLWSLHWEVVFSLLPPLFLVLGRATGRLPVGSDPRLCPGAGERGPNLVIGPTGTGCRRSVRHRRLGRAAAATRFVAPGPRAGPSAMASHGGGGGRAHATRAARGNATAC